MIKHISDRPFDAMTNLAITLLPKKEKITRPFQIRIYPKGKKNTSNNS